MITNRAKIAAALRAEGKTYREIGERLGVCPQRARQLVARVEVENQLNTETDPLFHEILNMNDMRLVRNAIRFLERGGYRNDYRRLAEEGARKKLLFFKGCGKKTIQTIGLALKRIGAIENVLDWMNKPTK